MRDVPGPEHDEWVRRMRALARRDAEEMVPRPAFPVFGLSSPRLEPAVLAAFEQMNGSWVAVTVAYGPWEAVAGPYVAVKSERTDPGLGAPAGRASGREPEEELLRAVGSERDRVATHAGVDDTEPARPPRYSREDLPAGPALVCRHGTVWAARLRVPGTGHSLPGHGLPGVTVTVTGRGVGPGAVRLEPLSDLRPMFDARNELLGRLAERRRLEPPPDLEPAEGVAAFRALADFSLEGQATRRAAARDRRAVRQPPNWGAMHRALWQRAVREQQRIAGVDKRAADDVVTSVINHLGHLAEQAPWFTAGSRLREAAIDETLRHAVLGESVRSLPAQQAWARYWAQHPASALRDTESRLSLADGWLAAWAAWTATA